MITKNVISVALYLFILATFTEPAAQDKNDKGTAEVSVKGTELDITGNYSCTKCGEYFYPLEKKGVLFEVKIDKWTLQLANGRDRKAGSQVYKGTDVTVLFNGPGKYYGYNNVKPAGNINFSEDFKTAEIDVELKNVINPKDIINIKAKFNCE